MSQQYQTNWYSGDDDLLHYGSANAAAVLHCHEGQWVVSSTDSAIIDDISYCYIKAGNSGYISSTTNSNATIVNSTASATKFVQNDDSFHLQGQANQYARVTISGNRVGNYFSLSNSTNYRLHLDDSNKFYFTYYNTKYYVVYSNGWRINQTQSNGTTFSLVYDKKTVTYGDKTIDRSENGIVGYSGEQGASEYYTTPSTYFPITVVDAEAGNYAPSEKNTGYITSGPTDPVKTGDLRVSYFYMSNIYRSLAYADGYNFSSNFETATTNNKRYVDSSLQVVTRTSNSNGLV